MLNSEAIAAIVVAAYLHALWEDANGRRRDEEGKAPRSRLGYTRLLMKHLGFSHKAYRRDLLARLTFYYNREYPVR